MKKYLLMLFVLLLVPFVFAEEYSSGQEMTITAYYIENAVPTDIDNVTITIILPTGLEDVIDENMTRIDVGTYEYKYTPPFSGVYTVQIKYYNDSVLLGTGSGTFNVDMADKLLFGKCPETKTGQTNMWMIVGIFFILGIVGMFTKIIGLPVLGGFGLIFTSLITWGCGAIIGYGLIITGIVYIMIALSIRPLY